MRARILGTAAAICLLPIAAWAQDGLRSASLPDRPLTSRRAPARDDQFRADPDTYTTRKDLYFQLPVFVPLPVYWYVSDVLSPYPATSPPAPRQLGSDPPTRGDSWGQTPITPPTAPAPPAPPAAPGPPKTFFVIPGCYAGDTPPRAAWLPSGCDPSAVRVIPP